MGAYYYIIYKKRKMMTSNSNSQTKTQGFKKKTSNLAIDTNNSKPADKFNDLKSKLQKEKQLMKKTGRRFRQDNSISTQEVSISTNNEITEPNSKHDISIGPQESFKQTISLKEINLTDQSARRQQLNSSQIFQKQFKQQKKRSNQVYNFLKTIELQSFAEALIQNGFDDLQSLTQVATEDLNNIMMRAHQQIKLGEAIKGLKQKMGLQPSKPLKQQFQSTQIVRLKTQPMQYPAGVRPRGIQSAKIIARLKTQNDKQQNKTAGPKVGSFLYNVGSKNWSVEDQIRRACSVCFRVQQQMQKKGQCYYCQKCYKFVSGDLLQISIGKNMDRSYKKQ